MRIFTLVFILLVHTNLQAETFAMESLYGDCYFAEFEYQDPYDKNVLTICLNEGKAVARMIFSNSENLSAVCYQTGTSVTSSIDHFTVSLQEGQCDNARPYSSDELDCKQLQAGLFRCDSPNGAIDITYLGAFG